MLRPSDLKSRGGLCLNAVKALQDVIAKLKVLLITRSMRVGVVMSRAAGRPLHCDVSDCYDFAPATQH